MPAISAKEQFDRQASHYDKQWNTWSEETLNWLMQAVDATPSDQILDVATGAGFTACALAPIVANVTATDVSSGMLEQASLRAIAEGLSNIEFVEAPAEKLPFSDACFDTVTCRIAAHHFLDVDEFVRESARVLKPGGRFVLVDTTIPDNNPNVGEWCNIVEEMRDRSHVKNLSKAEWSMLVSRSGLTIVEASNGGNGITINLVDWLKKSGTEQDVALKVREMFLTAQPDVKAAFKINHNQDDIQFTWMRLLLKAVKPK